MGDVVSEGRPHWDVELVETVGRLIIPRYRSVGYLSDHQRERIYAVIAAVEDEQRRKLRSDGSQCSRAQEPLCECCYDVVQIEDHNVALEAQVKELLDLVKNQDDVEQGLRAQIQAVRDVMNEWNAEADRIFAGEPHEPLYYGAAAEALRIALDADR